MKKNMINIMNIFFTTGVSLTVLAVFYVFFSIKTLTVHTIFEILGANIIINFGILLLHKLEIRHIFLEYLLDICFIVAVLVIFGIIFDWYTTPVWVLVIMAVVIYSFAMILRILDIKSDTKIINDLLQKRDENISNSAS